MKHPAPRTSTTRPMPVAEGGLNIPCPLRGGTRWGGDNLLAEGVHRRPVGSERFRTATRVHHADADGSGLGWRPDGRGAGCRSMRYRRSEDELEDRPFRRYPARRHQARLCALRERKGPLPLCGPSRIRCRCTANRCTRRAATLLPKYATYADRKQAYRLPTQVTCLHSGRTTSFQGLPDRFSPPGVLWNMKVVAMNHGRTRGLAELQQDMFVEINTA